jgi:hypothetical protein
MTIYIANALHLIARDAEGVAADYGLAPDGRPSNGINRPYWDTLFGLLNKEAVPVTARFRLWKDSGAPVAWPDTGFNHSDVILEPGLSWAASFIPNNGWPNPPLDWAGHCSIETVKSSPFGPIPADSVYAWAMASGGNWDGKSPSVEVPVRKNLPARAEWFLPYAIPNYEDANHTGPNAYETGLAVPNFSPQPVTVTITYVVNQNYASKGQRWSFQKSIPANGGARFSIIEELRAAGYNPINPATGVPQPNTEGHIEIVSDVAAQLFPHAVIATKSYQFAAGQGFAD